MRLRYVVAIAIACLVVGWLLHQPDPPPDLLGEICVARSPTGEPDTPAPNGGRFVPILVTYDGRDQVTGADATGPVWVFWLAGGRIVIHAVRVPEVGQ